MPASHEDPFGSPRGPAPHRAWAPAGSPARAAAARAARLRRARNLLVAAAVAVVLLLVGRADPGGSLAVHDLLDHPVVLGILAWGLAAAGIAGFVEDPVRRVVVAVLAAGVGATGFGLAGLVISAQLSPDRTTRVLPAPGGAPLRAVVTDDGDQRHPVTRVVVEGTGSYLTARRHEVACVQGLPGTRTDVAWQGGAVRVAAPGQGTHVVPLTADGASSTPLRLGLLCTR